MLRLRQCRGAATACVAVALSALLLMPAGQAAARGGPGGPGGGGNPGYNNPGHGNPGYNNPGYPGRPGGPQYRDRMPPGHGRVIVGGNPYYFHGGHYYRPMRGGFVAVFPPVGLVIRTLPPGFEVLVVAGLTYYVYDSIYYQPAPGGYVVVSPPATVAVAPPSGMVAPLQSDRGSCVVIAAALNVRSGPGMAYPIITVVNQGDILDLQGRTGSWIFVRLPNGNVGWVDGQFTTQNTTPPASGQFVNGNCATQGRY